MKFSLGLNMSGPIEEAEIMKEYIVHDLKDCKYVYLISSKWYSTWLDYVGLSINDLSTTQKEEEEEEEVCSKAVSEEEVIEPEVHDQKEEVVRHSSSIKPPTIENKMLLQDDHELKKDIQMGINHDFIYLSAKVWNILSAWYNYDISIKREVISHPQEHIELYPLSFHIQLSTDINQNIHHTRHIVISKYKSTSYLADYLIDTFHINTNNKQLKIYDMLDQATLIKLSDDICINDILINHQTLYIDIALLNGLYSGPIQMESLSNQKDQEEEEEEEEQEEERRR